MSRRSRGDVSGRLHAWFTVSSERIPYLVESHVFGSIPIADLLLESRDGFRDPVVAL